MAGGRFGLGAQVLATMLVVVVGALALTTLLNVLRFEQTLFGLVERRLDVVAREVAGDVLVGVDLGLPLAAIENLPAIVNRVQQAVDGVSAVTVHACDGTVLASAGGSHGVRVEAPQEARWTRHSTQGLALGRMLTNSYGACAGGVLIEQDAAAIESVRATVRQRLILIAVLSALLVVPAMAWVGRMFRRRDAVLAELRRDLDRIGQGHLEPPSLALDQIRGEAASAALVAAYLDARPALIAGVPSAGPAPSPAPAEAPATRARWSVSLVRQVLVITAAALVSALAVSAIFTADVLRDALLPELARKSQAEAVQATRLVQRGLDLRIPLASLRGVDDLHAELRDGDGDLAFLAIVGVDGVPRHAEGLDNGAIRAVLAAPSRPSAGLPDASQRLQGDHVVTRLPLHDGDGQPVAELVLGHPQAALLKPLRETFADLLIIALVSLFLGFEVMLWVVSVNLSVPVSTTLQVLGSVAARQFDRLQGDPVRGELARIVERLNERISSQASRIGVAPHPVSTPRIVGVRLLGFLFVFAEELARPILPSFLAAFGGEGDAMLGAGLIMALHMAMIALGMPLASLWYARIGRQRMYMLGALLATVGLLGTGLSGDLLPLLLFRMISGVGYAMTYVACQGFVIESTGQHNRARGSSQMVGGIMLADICGPAIGGIIAYWVGFETVFVIGAGVALTAALLVTRLMGSVRDHRDAPATVSLGALGETLRNGRFVALLLLGAVPAKLVLGAFLFYLVPLLLVQQGTDTAQVGRIIMIYGIIGLISGPALAYLTDRWQRPLGAVVIGGLVTALGLLPLFRYEAEWVIVLAVFALGLAQALSIPALVSAALGVSDDAVAHYGQGPVMAVLRLIERMGGALGPLVGAALVILVGPQAAMGWLGVYGLASVLLLIVLLRCMPAQPPLSGAGEVAR